VTKILLKNPVEKSQQTLTLQTGGRWSARETFAALRYPNYRLWFFGQMVSLMGTWMQATAQGFLVYELTRSPEFLGYVGFAAGAPTWLFMLYGGLIADRMSRRTLLVITQIFMMLLAFILAGLTFLKWVQPWQIIVFAFLLGVANAFDAPTRQAFVVEMVDREDLTNAIALNSTMFNSATAVGPAIGGLVYALVGPAWCFTINGLSFIAVIWALLAMRLKPVAHARRSGSALADIKVGLKYVSQNATIRLLIINMVIVSLFGMGFVTLFPAWSVDILSGDSTTNGFLQSARGLGALLGALIVASLGRYRYKGRLLMTGAFIFPCMLVVFLSVRWLPLALLALVGVGLGQMIMMNTSNAIVQTKTPDELRGRVMSIYTLSFFGFMPLGALLAGGLAARFGEPLTGYLGAFVLLGFALLVWWRVPSLRRSE
jgi:MFS family permease